MNRYMIVKIPNANDEYEEPVTFMGQTKFLRRSVLSRIGEAVRLASEKHFVGASWTVTHGSGLTYEESETVARIFEDVAARARLSNPKKYRSK